MRLVLNFLVFIFCGLAVSAQAATDWSAASEAWRAQYRELAITQAAQKNCGLDVPKPVRRALEQAREGLRDALSSFGPVEKSKAIVQAAGGKAKFCADANMMAQAKATLEKFSAQAAANADKATKAAPAQNASGAIATNAPTPVVDPNIALIRNCRQAVITKLGKQARKDDLFWSNYETCMKAQGVGWF